MNRYESFWIVTIYRGALAILLGSAILFVPDMARTLLLLPFAVAFAVLSLAAYGIVDSVLVFVTSFFASLRRSRTALRIQSALGIVLGALFFSILFDKLQLHWFLYLIALQAVAAAYSEYLIARHTSRRHGSRWSYAAAAAALLCAIAYTVAAAIAPDSLTQRQISLLAYAYLGAFGIAQVLMAARMLHIERQADALAHAAAHPVGL
jgi:uncharacterized membrane protein HdeD (DUF308 family)